MLSIFDLLNVGWIFNCFLCNVGDWGKVICCKLWIFKMICKGRVLVLNFFFFLNWIKIKVLNKCFVRYKYISI